MKNTKLSKDGWRRVEYADGLFLHVKEPSKRQRTRSCVLMFPGGAWRRCKWEVFHQWGENLHKKGVVAVIAEYDIKGHPSNSIQSGRIAAKWCLDRRDSIRFDPDRFAVVGESAGGFVAGFVANQVEIDSEKIPQPCWASALIMTNPVLDMGPDGYKLNRLGKVSELICNPSNESPPTLIMHGDQDRVVSLEKSVRYSESSVSACDLKVYHGCKHGELRWVGHYGDEAFGDACEFLSDLGFFKTGIKGPLRVLNEVKRLGLELTDVVQVGIGDTVEWKGFKRSYPDIKMIGFDPNEKAGPEYPGEIVHLAITNRQGGVRMNHRKFWTSEGVGGEGDVPCSDLDTAMSHRSIGDGTLLWISCNGHVPEILSGAKKSLARFQWVYTWPDDSHTELTLIANGYKRISRMYAIFEKI